MIRRSTDFCREIREEIELGKGIVPLLGAGISATAGIPTRPELMAYLRLCVTMALGLDQYGKPEITPWRPQLGWWPAMEGNWLKTGQKGEEILRSILDGSSVHPKDSSEQMRHFRGLCQEAFGSLVDWRLALQFLARLRVAQREKNPAGSTSKCPKCLIQRHAIWAYDTITLRDVDEHIIDSFFSNIVAGKIPSMGHHMVANLVPVLRVPVILSLNFDDLLEQAFRRSGTELSVFDIHHEAGLPPWSLLGKQAALVKLHGGRYGLRADFTLDRAPTERDRRHFRSYLIGHDVPEAEDRIPEDASKGHSARNHLLVGGVSGQDRRIRVLVRDALMKIADLKVFWCCYSSQDEKEVLQHFKDFGSSFVAVRHVHLGLLFWDIYQAVTYCLPHGGLDYPTTWRIPAPPSLVEEEVDELLLAIRKPLDSADAWLRESKGPRGLLVESPKSDTDNKARSRALSGVSALAWELFKLWNGPRRCVWIDCEDVGEPEQLRDYLLQAVTHSLGLDLTKPAMDLIEEGVDDELVLNELNELFKTSARPWILFVNLRGSPGYCSNSFKRLSLPKTNNELNIVARISKRRRLWEWTTDEKDRVIRFINKLSSIVDENVSVVVMRDEGTFKVSRYHFSRIISVRIPKSEKYQNWAAKRADSAIDWIKGEKGDEIRGARTRLLRAITLFQQVRHHTALVSRAVLQLRDGSEQWKQAWRETRRSLDELIAKRVLRNKAGGFLWIHWEIREHLRDRLVRDPEVSKYLGDIGSLHLGLADWHMTFFHATSDPRSVFQAVYHRCWVAKVGFELERDGHSLVLARGALCEASNHFELARAQILARGYHRDTRDCLRDYIQFLVRISKAELLCYRQSTSRSALKASERNLRFLHMVKVKTLLYRIAFERDVGRSEKVIECCKKLRKWLIHWQRINLRTGPRREAVTAYRLYEDAWQDEAFWNIHRLDLEWAIVCISLRDYDEALERLEKMLGEFNFPLVSIRDANRDADVWHSVNDWIDGQPRDRDHDQYRYLIRRLVFCVLRRYVETLLLKAEFANVLRESELGENGKTPLFLRRANMLYLAAQMLPRYVTEQENSLMRVEHSRLHSVMAGVLALSGDHDAVHRQINEAKIELASLPESEDSIAKAVLDLRFIYCKLAEMRSIRFLRQLSRQCLAGYGLVISDHVGELVRAIGILDEIETSLNRVESRLVSYRKSLWWWMTMCRYRMRWIEYTMLIKVAGIDAHKDLLPGGASLQRLQEDARRLMKDVMARTAFDLLQISRTLACFCNIIGMSVRHLRSLEGSRGSLNSLRDSLNEAVQCSLRVEKEYKKTCKSGKVNIQKRLLEFASRVRESASKVMVPSVREESLG